MERHSVQLKRLGWQAAVKHTMAPPQRKRVLIFGSNSSAQGENQMKNEEESKYQK
jgi:hypothetical protein